MLDLLHAIKEYAFVASEFPLMLTIENHLPVPLQNLLAQVGNGAADLYVQNRHGVAASLPVYFLFMQCRYIPVVVSEREEKPLSYMQGSSSWRKQKSRSSILLFSGIT